MEELKDPLVKLAHSPWPSWALSGAFLASSIFSPTLAVPPLVFRLGFSTIFAGSGYMTYTTDYRNGNGTTTAWALTYLFLYTRQTFRPPRNPWVMGLTLGTSTCAAIYGNNYFITQNFGQKYTKEEDAE